MSAVLIVVAGAIAGLAVVFLILQWHSYRTYRPSPVDIARLIQSTIDETISLPEFDTLSRVRIAYDSQLERIRTRYNDIVGSPQYIVGDARGPVAAVNEAGTQKLRELLTELEELGAKAT
jgi:hypothetical protein